MKNLKEVRREKKITQAEIAKVIGKKTTTYAKKERGEIPFTVNEAKEIINFLKCDVKIFF